MYRAKKDVKDAEGSLQVCAGQEAGSEAAINATYDIYQQECLQFHQSQGDAP